MEEFLAMIANTGFPIVVASYFILRMEQKLSDLNDSIQKLSHSIDKTIL